MSVSQEILDKFNGCRVKAVAINIHCAEDIPTIKQYLEKKYEDDVLDMGSHFCVAGKRYLKPWLPRERVGVFSVKGGQYFIESEVVSCVGRFSPRRSFYPIEKLFKKDESTIFCVVDEEKDYKIEYTLIDT